MLLLGEVERLRLQYGWPGVAVTSLTGEICSIRRPTRDTLPVLKGLSIKRLLTNPGAMRAPRCHDKSNAADIGADAAEFIITFRQPAAVYRQQAHDTARASSAQIVAAQDRNDDGELIAISRSK